GPVAVGQAFEPDPSRPVRLESLTYDGSARRFPRQRQATRAARPSPSSAIADGSGFSTGGGSAAGGGSGAGGAAGTSAVPRGLARPLTTTATGPLPSRFTRWIRPRASSVQ